MRSTVGYDPAAAFANREELRARVAQAMRDGVSTLSIERGYYHVDGTNLQGGGILPMVDLGNAPITIDFNGSTVCVGPEDTAEYCVGVLDRAGHVTGLRNLTLLGPVNPPGGQNQTLIGLYHVGGGGGFELENVALGHWGTCIKTNSGSFLHLTDCFIGGRWDGVYMLDGGNDEIIALRTRFDLDSDALLSQGVGQRHNVYIQEGVSHRFTQCSFARNLSGGKAVVPYNTQGNSVAHFSEYIECVFEPDTQKVRDIMTCRTCKTVLRNNTFHAGALQGPHITLRGDLRFEGLNRFLSHGVQRGYVFHDDEDVDSSIEMANDAQLEVGVDAPGYEFHVVRITPGVKTWDLRGRWGNTTGPRNFAGYVGVGEVRIAGEIDAPASKVLVTETGGPWDASRISFVNAFRRM